MVAIAVVPPTLEAVGELIDNLFTDLGLKERDVEYELITF